MLTRIRRARADLATMYLLMPRAERLARSDGEELPGAEHLLLAALDLEDGEARSALSAEGVSIEDLRSAIVAQHDRALAEIGVHVDEESLSAALPEPGEATGPFRATASLHAVFRRAVELRKTDRRPLSSMHILRAAAELQRGTLARVFDDLGIDRGALQG